MTFQPPPPAAKPRNNLRIVLIVVGIVLFLCCGGAVAAGVFLFKQVAEATGPARDAATAYVEDVIAEDYAGAYGRLCDEVRAKVSQEEYIQVQSKVKISGYDVTSTNVRSFNATVTATVGMRLTRADGGPEINQVFQLVKEDGGWRVCE